MESAATGGTKRKHKENAFTAKAETGTLKVKILRRDQRPGGNVAPDAAVTSTGKTRARRAARQPPPAPDSPPKPRPNRKHVPIFYEPQFRQPIKRGGSSHSHSSSTDESATPSTSSTGVPGIHSTSSTDVSAGVTGASTSSTTSSFVAQLSDVKIQSTSSSAADVGPPPRSNPLFARNDSDGLGTLGDLLRPIIFCLISLCFGRSVDCIACASQFFFHRYSYHGFYATGVFSCHDSSSSNHF
ncbi:uncharacterized protein IUM83_10766 [Phytophthora cinnamomi]|uniref:uncharacterized protein n=1 Tax=Phytophthora cinnamomi TaxID=4785 RepID=UPI00355A3AB1|nr:hypothetical protein IUM83_10766 [Phytophthora cinnamomi]